MSQLIVATFPNPRPAELAAQALFNDGCTTDQIHIVAGAPDGHEYQEYDRKQFDAAEIAGIAIILVTTTIIPGIGFLLTAIPASAALAATLPRTGDLPPDLQLMEVLRQAGLPEGNLHGYAEEVYQGHTLLTVAAADDAVNGIANTLRSNGAHALTYVLHQ